MKCGPWSGSYGPSWTASYRRRRREAELKKRFLTFDFGSHETTHYQASLSHFCMKLFLAAPESFLPSALTAFGSHASRLHFFRKLLRAAPAKGLPFLSIACARFLRQCRADRQGPNHGSEDNSLHRTSSFWCTCRYSKNAPPNSRNNSPNAPTRPPHVQLLCFTID